MNEEFLRKDTFNETMKRIEAMMAASEARHREYCAIQDTKIEEIRGEVKEIRQQVSGLENLLLVVTEQLNSKQNKTLNFMTSLIAGAAVVVAAVQVFIALFR